TDFFVLGFDPVLEISAEHGDGVAELLDEIVKRVGIRDSGFGIGRPSHSIRRGSHSIEPPESDESQIPNPESRQETRVAIVGRPNVGKSSLVNRLLKEERVLVSDMPGTTRDAIDSILTWHKRRFRIVDTAGMRRPGRVERGGASRLIETIERIAVARRVRVPTPALNRFVEAVTAANPPVSPGRRHVRILYAAQIGVAPPSFVFFTNVATTFHFSYQRFLVN